MKFSGRWGGGSVGLAPALDGQTTGITGAIVQFSSFNLGLIYSIAFSFFLTTIYCMSNKRRKWAEEYIQYLDLLILRTTMGVSSGVRRIFQWGGFSDVTL